MDSSHFSFDFDESDVAYSDDDVSHVSESDYESDSQFESEPSDENSQKSDIKQDFLKDILDYERSVVADKFGELPVATGRKGYVAKSWVFTVHAPYEKELKILHAMECNRKCVAKETVNKKGEECHHLQGIICFSKSYRFSGLRNILPRAHWEKCLSFQHAWNYCLKEGNFYTEDNRTQGRRQAVYDYRDRIKAGATNRELADEFPCEFLRFSRTDKMRNAYLEKRKFRTEGEWWYGPAGMGKSPMLLEKYPNADWLEYDGKYFSSYTNADVVILDDQWIGHIKPTTVLKLIDCTPYKLRVMGAYQEFNSKKVVFCSNYHWTKFWNEQHPLHAALYKRLGAGIPYLKNVYEIDKERALEWRDGNLEDRLEDQNQEKAREASRQRSIEEFMIPV